MFEDRTLICNECGQEFVFTAGEQEFYQEKGFTNDPKKCKACRDARKNAGRAERQMYPIVCDECGKEDKVPFPPKEGHPVYCSECYARRRQQ
jgi:CxxC-x17-CxxC domain-containing protein